MRKVAPLGKSQRNSVQGQKTDMIVWQVPLVIGSRFRLIGAQPLAHAAATFLSTVDLRGLFCVYSLCETHHPTHTQSQRHSLPRPPLCSAHRFEYQISPGVRWNRAEGDIFVRAGREESARSARTGFTYKLSLARVLPASLRTLHTSYFFYCISLLG